MPPETKYVRVGDSDTYVAYQVIGEGPPDLLFAPPFISHLDVAWEQPRWVDFITRLASFSRVITYDKRGTGMSDPPSTSGAPPLEQRMDEIKAVLDEIGSRQAALLGVGEGASAISLFAATYPERAQALILCNAIAKHSSSPDYPWGWATPEWYEAPLDFSKEWLQIEMFAPSHAGDPEFREWFTRLQRLAASPSMVRALRRTLGEADIRSILPIIRTPTLVIHRKDNRVAVAENGRYIADHIPGARFVLVPGADQWIWCGDTTPILDEVEEFVTGARRAPEPDRVLASVLVTDIVSSTEHAAELGDRRWRELLDQHNTIVRRELVKYRGREIDTTGDGFIASFDGPARSVECAWSIGDSVRHLGLQTRAGVHTGECQVTGESLAGIALHIAVRICSVAGPGEVVCSGTVKDLVIGSGIHFGNRGTHTLKGVPGDWVLFAAER